MPSGLGAARAVSSGQDISVRSSVASSTLLQVRDLSSCLSFEDRIHVRPTSRHQRASHNNDRRRDISCPTAEVWVICRPTEPECHQVRRAVCRSRPRGARQAACSSAGSDPIAAASRTPARSRSAFHHWKSLCYLGLGLGRPGPSLLCPQHQVGPQPGQSLLPPPGFLAFVECDGLRCPWPCSASAAVKVAL